MHDCPRCQQACGCDEDDIWTDSTNPNECFHECAPYDAEDDEWLWENEPEGHDGPCGGAFACQCRQCVRELGP
jgi:hypothetical protein